MRFTNNQERAALQMGNLYFAYFYKGTPFNRKKRFYIIVMTESKMFRIF